MKNLNISIEFLPGGRFNVMILSVSAPNDWNCIKDSKIISIIIIAWNKSLQILKANV